jgi:putative membrane protein
MSELVLMPKGEPAFYAETMSPGDELAVDRTFLAHERTLMAWIRTATSLISFGFSIYKFFQYLVATGTDFRIQGFFGPREFAISMLSLGVISLGVAVLDHRRNTKTLEQTYGTRHTSIANKLAIAVCALGATFLVLVLMHD